MKHGRIIKIILWSMVLLVIFVGCNKSNVRGQHTNAKNKHDNMYAQNAPFIIDNPNVNLMVTEQQQINEFEDAVRMFESKYGGKVSFIVTSYQESEVALIAALNAGDPIDAVRFSHSNMPMWAVKGLLQPIKDYFDLKDPIWNLSIMDQFKYREIYYGVAGSADTEPYIIIFNKALFDKYGITTPLEHYNDKTWNWEMLRYTAKQLTRDLDNDRTIDLWGLFPGDPFNFVISNGADIVDIKDDGSIQVTLNNPRTLEALQFYQEGIMKGKYMFLDNWKKRFTEGKLAMIVERPTIVQTFKDNIVGEVEIAPFPIGPGGAKEISPATGTFWGIGKEAKSPQAAAILIYLNERMHKESSGQRQTYLTVKQTELVQRLGSNVVIPKFAGIAELGANNKKLNNSLNKLIRGRPIDEVIQEMVPLLQSEIDSFLAKVN